MGKVLYLETINDMRTMLDPYRMKIQHVLMGREEPLTVKDISVEMGEPHGKVYYHIKKMMNLGAIEVVRTEKINGITAKYLALTFDSVEVKNEDEDQVIQSMTHLVEDVFNGHRDQIVKWSIRQGKDNNMGFVEKQIALVSSSLYLDETSYQSFIDDLGQLVEKYSKQKDELTEKTFFYTLYSK